VARSKPAGSHCDARALFHAYAEAANADSFTCPVDRHADGNRHRHRYGDTDSYAFTDCYTDPHGYANAYLDGNFEATDADPISNSHTIAYSCAAGSVGT
jgi:hypothetical protein